MAGGVTGTERTREDRAMRTGWMVPWLAVLAAAACDGSGPTDVADPRVHVVEIDPPAASLEVGDTIRLTALARTVDGEALSGLGVTWTSQTTTHASVVLEGTRGRVLAIRAGTAIIWASIGGKLGQAEIDISNRAPILTSISPASVSAEGPGFTLVVTGEGFAEGSTVEWNGAARPTTYVRWTELRANIPASDVGAQGTAEVRVVTPAPGGGPSEPQLFTVEAPPPSSGPVVSVEIDVGSVALEEGGTLTLTATPKDAQGRVVGGRYVAWTSSNAEVLSVDAIGKAVGIRPGSVMIRAQVDGVKDSIPALVTADYAYDLVFTGWDGVDPDSPRFYLTDLSDSLRSAVRVGPDAPSGGAVPSPDGQRVAYMALSNLGARSLMVANRDGMNAKEILFSTDTGCGRFTWSPDSQKLAFACAVGDMDKDIWVVDADGQNLVNITDTHTGHQEWPSWSPYLTGGTSRIAYAQFVAGEPQIWTMEPDGSGARQVTGGMDHQPAWSPDGTAIAFQRTGAALFGDIWLVDADGGNERGLAGLYLAGPQQAPAWSPDGRLVAFSSTHETYGTGGTLIHQVYTVWADGSKLARRTAGTLQSTAPTWRVR